MDEEENALVRRVALGDEAALRSLLERHVPSLAAYAQRMLDDGEEARDVVQETCLRLWTRADRFDPKRARLTTWLHRVAHNLCLDRLRRRGRGPCQAPGELFATIASDEPGPEASAAAERRRAAVRRGLMALTEAQRAALLLTYYQGLANRDAAQVLGVRVEALESLLVRARGSMRRYMEAEHGE